MEQGVIFKIQRYCVSDGPGIRTVVFLKGCLKEYKDCDAADIAERYIEGQPQAADIPVHPDGEGSMITGMNTEDKAIREGTVTYDIRFRALVPDADEWVALIINVEAQNVFHPGYPLLKRAVYYCSRMISAQYGREFTGQHYERIKKVYSIWICMDPPKKRANTVTRYRLTEEHLVGNAAEPARNYDLLSVVMLCLGSPEDENYGGVLRMLEVLLSNDLTEAEKERILQSDYGIPMTVPMREEMSAMCNLSDGIEARGLEKGLKLGEEKGMEKGVEKGIRLGEEKGIESTYLASIKNLMKKMSLSADNAMSVLEIPEAERQRYRDLLRQR